MEFNWTDVEDIGVLREYTWELGGLINGAHLGGTVHDDETDVDKLFGFIGLLLLPLQTL